MKKKIIIMVLTLVLSTIFLSGCTEEDVRHSYTREEVLQKGEFYNEERFWDLEIITGYSNETVFIYDVKEGKIIIGELQYDTKWDANYMYKENYSYYPYKYIPSLASEDYIGVTVRFNYMMVESYDDVDYYGGVYYGGYIWMDGEIVLVDYEIGDSNHTYWQECQDKKQEFYDFKDNFSATEIIHIDLGYAVDKYGAGMYTKVSVPICFSVIDPDRDLIVDVDYPDHLNDFDFNFTKISSEAGVLNITVFGTEPGRFKHGKYTVELKYYIFDWHLDSNKEIIGQTDIIINLV